MKTQKVFKTENDTILIVTADTKGCNNRNYVSVTANEIEPMTKEDAKTRVKEGLEDGELWRIAVESERTEQGLEDWIESILDNDELDGFDNSLYPNILSIEGEEYIYDSRSCGCLHNDIKELTHDFDRLIELHLQDTVSAVTEADKIIRKLKSDDVDFMVEKFTREIIGIEA